jgi:predicted ATPase/class 3 adenylate cyclase
MATPPSGTVTFLFTDIEGSTRRWDAQPDAMRRALARHDAILRDAIERHGGHVFKTVGDAFHAAFGRPEDALSAAVDAQRVLAAEGWGGAVRIALHTGTADERDGDYFGPPLNRVARLRDSGHGGQILLSAVAAALVAGQVPEGVEVRNIGFHRLRDLAQTEQVYQAAVWGLPADFPPLRTEGERHITLPTPPTSLIGRESAVAEVVGLLRTARLATLTGPGGVGKTRVAIAVAAALQADFADGVFFVDLSPLVDGTLVDQAIAATIGMPMTSETSLYAGGNGARPSFADRLIDWLRAKQLLLVLDNFEQVLDAAPLVARLLATVAQLRVLVTSRAPLRLQGEQEFPVPTLPVPSPLSRGQPDPATVEAASAVRLFVERARSVQPDFALNVESASAVSAICRRLDGLPLALELAAARVKLLPPATLLERLSSRLSILTGGPRDAPARQRTLRATIAWSYDLLAPAERALVRRLAVCAGGCTLAAAEALAAAPPALDHDLLDGLAGLVDQSLLRQELGRDATGGPRYAMLETVREFGKEVLREQGEAAAVSYAHARWCLRFARHGNVGLRGPDQALWLARLEDERDNFRAALTWVQETGKRDVGLQLGVALTWFWFTSSQREGYAWLASLLSLPGECPVLLEGSARFCAALFAWSLDRYDEAVALAETSVPLCRAAGDPTSLGYALLVVSLAYEAMGASLEAEAAARESLTILEPLGDGWATPMAYQALGAALDDQDRYDEARAAHETSIALRRRQGDRWGVSTGLGWLSRLLVRQGDYAAARQVAAELGAIHRDHGDVAGITRMLTLQAEIALWEGDYDEASRLQREAVALAANLHGALLHSVTDLGYISHLQGDDRAARQHLRRAIELGQELGSLAAIARAFIWLAAVAARDGAWQEVARWLGASTSRSNTRPLEQAARHVREEYERLARDARAALGTEAYIAAYTEGRALALDAAVALALEQTAASSAGM